MFAASGGLSVCMTGRSGRLHQMRQTFWGILKSIKNAVQDANASNADGRRSRFRMQDALILRVGADKDANS